MHYSKTKISEVQYTALQQDGPKTQTNKQKTAQVIAAEVHFQLRTLDALT